MGYNCLPFIGCIGPIGPGTSYVTVPIPPSTSPLTSVGGFFGGDIGMLIELGDPQNPPNWPNPPVDAAGVKSQIANWLSKDQCSKFITSVLNLLGKKRGPLVEGPDVLKLFGDVAMEGGFVRGKPPDGGRLGGGTFRGRIGKNATIYLPGFDPLAKTTQAQVNVIDAGGIFHELLHLANKKTNDDKRLSTIIRDAGFGVGDFPTAKNNDNLDFSKYINRALSKNCGTP